jgi:hypothetical protein
MRGHGHGSLIMRARPVKNWVVFGKRYVESSREAKKLPKQLLPAGMVSPKIVRILNNVVDSLDYARATRFDFCDIFGKVCSTRYVASG